jgi:hypothetical protein
MAPYGEQPGKNRHRMMKSAPFRALIWAAAILLTGCEKQTGPGPEIHDTKYAAIDTDGEAMDIAAGPPICVLDQFTGLMWEAKTDTPGLHDWRNTYSWYNPEEPNKELDYRGTPGAGKCSGSECDTWNYLRAVNAAGLCGYHDWRIPARDEIASLNDPRKFGSPPTTNTQYFPHAQPDEYWTSNDYSFQWDAAWVWNFQHGLDRVEWKKTPRFLRLVRGEAMHLKRVED